MKSVEHGLQPHAQPDAQVIDPVQLPHEARQVERALSIREVCERLGISPSTFYERQANGRIPIKPIQPPICGRPRYSASDVEAWIRGDLRPRSVVRRGGRRRRA